MNTGIRTHIIKIGNSQGIRIPKLLLDQSDLVDEVELELEEGKIVIRPARPESVRVGWDERFRAMSEAGDDTLPEDYPTTEWDEEEWEW